MLHMEAHELTNITLEYRRECCSKEIVDSLMAPTEEDVRGKCVGDEQHMYRLLASGPPCHSIALNMNKPRDFTHLLRMQGEQHDILRGQTMWRIKMSDQG